MSPWYWIDKLMSEIRNRRPDNIRPKMPVSERAKQFAPFAALGRMDRALDEVRSAHDVGDPDRERILDDMSVDEIMSMLSENAISEMD